MGLCFLLIFVSLSSADYHSVSFGGSVTVSEESTNEMYILGDESTITEYGNFVISIYLDPVEEFKAWNLDFNFNSSAIHAISIEEGDIFDGYSTVFMEGTINNTVGNISMITSIILGAYNVSSPGYLCNITFEPQVASGVSELNFSLPPIEDGYLITFDLEYLDCNTTNGSITLDISDFPVWSNWSSYWKIGQTSVGDIDLDMDVDTVDVNLLRNDYLNTTGIDDTDLNDDGIVNYLDRSLIQNFWGDDYT